MPELGADAGSEDWGLCDHAPRCLYQHAVSDSWIGPDDDPPPFGQGLLARWLAGYSDALSPGRARHCRVARTREKYGTRRLQRPLARRLGCESHPSVPWLSRSLQDRKRVV